MYKLQAERPLSLEPQRTKTQKTESRLIGGKPLCGLSLLGENHSQVFGAIKRPYIRNKAVEADDISAKKGVGVIY